MNNKENTIENIELNWIEPHDNIWNIKLVDLRPITQTLQATSSNPQMAENAISYNGTEGKEFFSQQFESDDIIDTEIIYNIRENLEEGIMFRPSAMEHKWAIYYQQNKILFVRSWLRKTTVIAETVIKDNHLIITKIKGKFTENEDPNRTKLILNYLLISHVIQEVVPTPLEMHDDLNKTALWAFSLFGNMAIIGTFENTFFPKTDKYISTYSTLHLASVQNDFEEIIRQIKKGANINYLSCDGYSPLHWSLHSSDIKSMILLIENNANIDILSEEGTTPLMNAIQLNKIEHIKRLIEFGANVNIQDNRGFTALHRAAEMGSVEIVELLIKNNAKKDLEANGHNALSLAKIRGHKEIIELLN